MSAQFDRMIDEIRNRSLQLHKEHSLLNRICDIKPVEKQTEDFHVLQQDSGLDRVGIENGLIVRPENMVNALVNDELDFIINPIQNNSQEINNENDLFQTIRTTASELRDKFLPMKIVIPRNISSEILTWNRIIDPNSNATNTLNVGLKDKKPLEVILLPLNYHFSKILILSQYSIFCEFIPNQKRGLLDVGLELDRGLQIPFWLRVVLRLEGIRYEAIRIINFEN